MRNFNQGQTVRIRATFRDFDDALINPSTVTVYIQTEADDDWTSYASPTHESTGIYHQDVETEGQSGIYDWRVIGTGTTSHANQGQFYVVPLNPGESAPA